MVFIPRALSSSNGHNIMTHVRRLDLQDVIAETLINLVTAILVAGTIPLTHLTISTTVSRIKRAVALVLVDSLRNAPNLAVLRLSGLHFVNPVFFALLGQCVPNLKQLVIEYKPGILLSKSYPKAPWPFPSYRYAPLFAAFPYLEHLGLNIPVVDVSCTTKYLARMESSYQDMSLMGEGGMEEDGNESAVDCIALEGARAMARLFAVHVPRLRTIFFEQVTSKVWNSAWAIDRDLNGRPLPRRDLTREERSRGMKCGSFRWAADWEFSEKESEEVLRGASTPSST
ncbi:hypothetical protein K523DRAFT_300158 [Schizophyllum commune Tattone D]|nr:hypothetical protein K523DRAFT_300158 [Schizophyllum commune Tattone D]